jgi:hypothetical protein
MGMNGQRHTLETGESKEAFRHQRLILVICENDGLAGRLFVREPETTAFIASTPSSWKSMNST